MDLLTRFVGFLISSLMLTPSEAVERVGDSCRRSATQKQYHVGVAFLQS
jgi:hypothetical protein